MTGRAVLAFDDQCRMLLERRFYGKGPDVPTRTAAWLLCNPSTADAERDDPTVRRMMHFTQRADCDRMLVGNVWAWRATDPADMWRALASGAYTPEMHRANLDALAAIGCQADVLFVAYGAAPGRLYPWDVQAALGAFLQPDGPDPICLGTTADGLPLHPLARGKHAVRNDVPLTAWRPLEPITCAGYAPPR